MKLPKLNELKDKDELYLYKQDINAYNSFADFERIERIISLIEKYSFGKKILDVGCAQGNIATLLAEQGFETVALDLNQNFLNYTKKKREFGNISYICASAMNMPFKDNAFDAVIIGELIEHVAYPEKLLQEARRVLKLGGLMVITTPNNHIFLGMLSGIKPGLFENIKDRNKLLKRQFGPAGKDHLFVFNLPCLEKLIISQGFEKFSSGYSDSCIINSLSYKLLGFLPRFVLQFIDRSIINNPFKLIKSKFSADLYIAARKK